jgi:hypothetical protein
VALARPIASGAIKVAVAVLLVASDSTIATPMHSATTTHVDDGAGPRHQRAAPGVGQAGRPRQVAEQDAAAEQQHHAPVDPRRLVPGQRRPRLVAPRRPAARTTAPPARIATITPR